MFVWWFVMEFSRIIAVISIAFSSFVLSGFRETAEAGVRFCNAGETAISYRRVSLSTKSFGRYPSKTIGKDSCGPIIKGFPTVFAFFYKNNKKQEFNLVFDRPRGRNTVESKKGKIPIVCFNPLSEVVQRVPRAYGETAWLTSDCPIGEIAARTSITIYGIRGTGVMEYHVAVPKILPSTVWFDGRPVSATRPKANLPPPEDPGVNLFSSFSGTSILFDQLDLDSVSFPMKYSKESELDLLASIDGVYYNVEDLLKFYEKLIRYNIADATERRLSTIFLRPRFIQNDAGGHVVIYPDLRRSELIIGSLPPGALFVGEGDPNLAPILRELANSSFFVSSDAYLGYSHSLDDYMEEVGAGVPAEGVAPFMSR